MAEPTTKIMTRCMSRYSVRRRHDERTGAVDGSKDFPAHPSEKDLSNVDHAIFIISADTSLVLKQKVTHKLDGVLI